MIFVHLPTENSREVLKLVIKTYLSPLNATFLIADQYLTELIMFMSSLI